MKKKLYDLTIEEFTRLLCDVPKTYELSMKEKNENGKVIEDTAKGTYEKLSSVFKETGLTACLDYVENNFFDYNMELSSVDIIDYLDFKTKGFEITRCKAIENDMEVIHDMIIDEERIDAINRKITNGWPECPVKNGMVDYEKAKEYIFGCGYDLFYYNAIHLLLSKIREQRNVEEPTKVQTGYLKIDKNRNPEILKILKYDNSVYDNFMAEIQGKNLKECAEIFRKFLKTGKAINPDKERGAKKCIQEFLQEITGEKTSYVSFNSWIR